MSCLPRAGETPWPAGRADGAAARRRRVRALGSAGLRPSSPSARTRHRHLDPENRPRDGLAVEPVDEGLADNQHARSTRAQERTGNSLSLALKLSKRTRPPQPAMRTTMRVGSRFYRPDASDRDQSGRRRVRQPHIVGAEAATGDRFADLLNALSLACSSCPPADRGRPLPHQRHQPSGDAGELPRLLQVRLPAPRSRSSADATRAGRTRRPRRHRAPTAPRAACGTGRTWRPRPRTFPAGIDPLPYQAAQP